MAIFHGTVSTSGSSYVVAIPKQIIESLKLSKGAKVEIYYENDRISIPFHWSRLAYRCEKMLNEGLKNFTEWMLNPLCVFHPYTYHILSSLLLIFVYVNFRTFNVDDFHVKFYRNLMISLHTNVDTKYPAADFRSNGGKGFGNQEEIDKLNEIIPRKFNEFLTDHTAINDILYVTEKGRVGSASYAYVNSLLEMMESREFRQFLDELFLMENTHQYSNATFEDPLN